MNKGMFDIDGRAIRFEQGSPLAGQPAERSLDAQVWFTREGLAIPKDQRTERHHYAVCIIGTLRGVGGKGGRALYFRNRPY